MSGKGKTAKDKRKAKKEKEVTQQLAGDSSALKAKADKAFIEKQYDQAIELYTSAINEDKSNEKLYSNRAAAYQEKKDYAKALLDASTCTKLKPDWCRGFFRVGQALEAQSKLMEALDAYKKAHEMDKTDELSKASLDALSGIIAEMKIQSDSVTASTSANPEKDKFEILVDWLKKGGAKFPFLYMQYYDEDYRGVHALCRIPTDSIILEVPLNLIMTSEVAKDSDVGKKIINSGCKLRSTHSYLAAYLCQEKAIGAKSKWAPYINCLPVHYRNMPIFFEEDELKWLRGSFSLKKIADRKEDLLAEYENICKHVPEFRQYPPKEFIWARMAVITRIFGLVIHGNKTDGLVPMADMLNHKRPRDSKDDNDDNHSETSWTFDDKREGFTITSLKALQRGDQIFDSYGRKCNSRFFVNYGFSLDENEDNQAVIPLEVPGNDSMYSMKVRLAGHGNMRRRFQIPIQYKEKETKELFSFARFAHAKDKEVLVLGSEDNIKLEDIDPISIRNEIEALDAIGQNAAIALKWFDSTIEEDNKALSNWKATGLNNNIRNAFVMRRGEKEVLQHFVELRKFAIPLLQTPWKDLKKIAAKCQDGKGKFDQYVTMVVAPLVKAGGSR